MNKALFDYCLYLADSTLILGHRNSEWCGHGPILEQDIALTNISLDLIGQARNFYQYAALLKGNGATEDTLAYLRDVTSYRNCLLVELPNGHWGQTILRQFLFSTYQYYLFQQLVGSADGQLAAIAEKSLKEITYHVRWSSEWVIRLGDGTEESKQKMEEAVENIWPYTGELFVAAAYETTAATEGFGADLSVVQTQWRQKVTTVLEEATLDIQADIWMQQGGKNGIHTEHLGYILAEMQFLQRAYPGATW
jgi:ring-1,2-phenylacetyl-CoA epoxidase subunit PaaC